MASERVSRIHVRGLRSLEDVELDIDGITVLIGENATGAVRVVDLDTSRKTMVRRLDQEALRRWLEDYSGVGAIRAAGHLRSVVEDGGEGPDDGGEGRDPDPNKDETHRPV